MHSKLSDLPADLVLAPLRAAVAASRLIRIGASSRSADKGGAAVASPRLARAAAGARDLVRDSQRENDQVYTRTSQPSLVFQLARDRLLASINRASDKAEIAELTTYHSSIVPFLCALVVSVNRPRCHPRPGPARSRSSSRRRNATDLHP